MAKRMKTRAPRVGRSSRRVLLLSAALGVGLLAVVAVDYVATRRELTRLLRGQATTIRQIVAAAARSNREAGRLAADQIAGRLLDNARLLGELDRRGVLDQALLDDLARRNRLFRINVFRADGSLERAGVGPAAAGHGPGPGFGFGRGGHPYSRLLDGSESEFVTDVHRSRGSSGARVAAGVHRARGGAIILNVDASAIADLQRQASLDALISDIVEGADEIAYLVLTRGELRIERAKGSPSSLPPGPSNETTAVERHLLFREEPVIEFSAPVEMSGGTGLLRLGMRLTSLRASERWMLLLATLSLAASLLLAGLGVGTLWLERKYALLSDEHARAEAALRRRDRLTAMGELAATVAHEVRNPLNAIAMSAQRLKREVIDVASGASEGERSEAGELVRTLLNETQRIERIVRQFLEFARPPRLAPRPSSISEFIVSVADNARPLVEARGIALFTETKECGSAVFDVDQMRQALDNLVSNASEATEKGGRITIRGRSTVDEHVIEVADSGRGIAPEDLPRIFDLYFTTRTEGTGIGLAVAQQVVAAHGGTIEVDSRPGKGTRMIVRLPTRGVEAGRE
jgi:signal transduction histidine kinase